MSTVPNERLDRSAAADLWRHTLSQIASVFGRLVYLSSLRDANTDRYEHFGFAQMFGDEASDTTLRGSHASIFAQWLCFSLEEQKVDIDRYLSALMIDRKSIVEAWLRLRPYRHLIPSSVRAAERELYLTDLEVLLTLLKNDYGASSPDLDA